MSTKKKPMKAQEVEEALSNGTIKPDLPPPGYKRDNVLAERKDALEQEMQEFSDHMQVAAIDPSALEPDRDIQRAIYKDRFWLDIGDEWQVCYRDWVHNEGSQAWLARIDGWVPVTKAMLPKHEHFKCREDGTVRIGDVMAFCMPKEKFKEVEYKRHQAALRAQFGLEAEAISLADKYAGKLKLHSDSLGGNPYADVARKGAEQKTAFAARTALKHVGNKMKDGLVNGIPLK